MERWRNKIAVVTGANSGKGAVTCKALAEKGMIVIGLARSPEYVESRVRPTIAPEFQHNFHCHKCVVNDETSIRESFAWIEAKFGGVDILINYVDTVQLPALIGLDTSDTEDSIRNKNISTTLSCVSEALQSMMRSSFNGHVVLFGDLSRDHTVSHIEEMSWNMYGPPSKL